MRGTSAWEARDWATADAWERFTTGNDVGDAIVRPEILRSWHRCRDDYKIDPAQACAPPADDDCAHSLASARVVTELGSVGRSLAADAEAAGGLVAITDGAGRLLSAVGDRGARRRGEQSNLAPWSAWSERAAGTNGMGTALEYPSAILVRRSEHWCEGLRDWCCAGITIRDPVTGSPLAVLDVSSWRKPLPDSVLPALRRAVRGIERELHDLAARDAAALEAALERADRRGGGPLVALDAGGGVVAASGGGEPLTGTCCPGLSGGAALAELARRGVARARADRSWVGFAEPFLQAGGDVVPLTIRPVITGNRVIGVLAAPGESEGEQLSVPAVPARPPGGPPRRVLAVQGSRLIMLHPQQVLFAEAEQNTVWLTTDRGRLRARERVLARLEAELSGSGFVRVHRHFVVNAQRVREITRGFRGQLALVMDPGCGRLVPVSRRRGAAVRRALAR
ncbi:MAG TPA: LytTR family transcriptional regulator DNA-binding domain-containing protein [Streptosporangiaceae bacterium]